MTNMSGHAAPPRPARSSGGILGSERGGRALSRSLSRTLTHAGTTRAPSPIRWWHFFYSSRKIVECGVWSVECGVWNAECSVWSVRSGVYTGHSYTQFASPFECAVWEGDHRLPVNDQGSSGNCYPRCNPGVNLKSIFHICDHLTQEGCIRSNWCRGTSLIRNTPLLGPYRRTTPKVLWWS